MDSRRVCVLGGLLGWSILLAVGCSDSEPPASESSGAGASGASGASGGGGAAASAGVSGAGGSAGASGSGGNSGASGSGGTGGTAQSVVWGACPEGYQSECATLVTPLDHANPSGEAIDLHIAKLSAQTSATRQLWLLSGGPGQGGHVYHDLVAQLATALPDTDIYVIDHRGTGHSHRLACPQQDTADSYGGYSLQPSDVPACLEFLKSNGDYDRLAHFTTRQAANDLALAISATRAPGQKVFVWGGSYGTHWAHRFLQVAPSLANGIVFDGFMTPNHFAFTHYDHGVEEAATNFSQLCAADAACSARMGADPLGHAKQILAGLAQTPCGQFERSNARTWASIFMDGFYSHAFVFPMLARLERCNADDKTATVKLVQNYYAALTAGPPEPFLNSGILQYNIVLSELWKLPGETSPTQQELADAADSQAFLSGASYPASLVPLLSLWPLPEDDFSSLPLPVSATPPLLWLGGALDTRTPPEQASTITSLYSAESQHFVMIPGAVHTPSFGSPRASVAGATCGLDMITHFVSSDGQVDSTCLGDLVPTLFSAPSIDFSQKWWGSDDDWGDSMNLRASSPALSSSNPRVVPRSLPSPAAALALQKLAREGRLTEIASWGGAK